MPNWTDLLREFQATSLGSQPNDSGEVSAPPPRVEGYRVERLLGAHGQGQVYLAEELASGDSVAIKRWRVPSQRAERELQALLALDHPGVVRVRAGADDAELGLPCLIMDYVEGAALCEGRARLDGAAAVAVGIEVAHALAEVHGLGLVHRDVKPANLLRRENGTTVLLDFGLVKDVALHTSELTGAGPVGTLPYMAPEQLGLIEVACGPQTDLYGLGATLYECLTGAVPFETNGSFERQGRDVWRDPPAGAEVGGVPPGLRAVISQCLSFQPGQRPASAEAVANALQGCLVGSPGRGARKRGALALLVALALTALGVGWAVGREGPLRQLVLQPGPLRGRDTYVSSVNLYRNDNFGPSEFLRVGFRPPSTGQAGERRSFVAFDLAGVPRSATLVSARLELYCTHSEYGSGPAALTVHEVAPSGARTPWVEGTGLLDRTLDGVAWSGVFATQVEAEGSDRPELSQPDVRKGSQLEPKEVPTQGTWWTVDVTRAVRRWLVTPAENYGLRLSSRRAEPSVGSWCFASSDSPDPARRPRLVLRYRGAEAAGPIEAAARAGSAEAAGRDMPGRQEAINALDYARTLLRRGKPAEAFEALSAACRAAPDWGGPYFQRAALARRLGFHAVVWLDSERSLVAAFPLTTPEALLLYAESWAEREGDSARAFACAAAVVAACSPQLAADADAVLRRLLSRNNGALRRVLARAEFRHLVGEALLRYSKGALVSTDGFAGPFAIHALWAQAAGEMAKTQRLLAVGRARSDDPVLRAIQVRQGKLIEDDPRVVGMWVRVLTLYGAPAQASDALARGRRAWPQDEALLRLATYVERLSAAPPR